MFCSVDCRRTRLEKENQLGGYCSNLEEEIVGQTRAMSIEEGDVDTLESHSCLGGRIGRMGD